MPPSPRPERKTDEVIERLRALAYQVGPCGKLPSIRTLCQQFTTTRVTLDGALRVLEEAQMIERKPGSGIYVSPELHYKRICVLLNSASLKVSPFWSILYGWIADEAQQRAQRYQERFSFYFLTPSPDRVLTLPPDLQSALRKGLVHGVLGVDVGEPNDRWLSALALPFVTYASWGPYRFNFDTSALMRMAFEQLFLQGCRHIELWIKEAFSAPVIQQAEVLFADYGLSLPPERVRRLPSTDDYANFQRVGYQLVMQIFRQDSASWPDGIICMEDMVTDGALLAFQHLQIPLGSRVRIASHANAGSPILFGRTHDLTLIEFDPRQLVHALFSLLARLIAGESIPRGWRLFDPKIRQPEGLSPV